MIGIIILGAAECVHGLCYPFRSKIKNYQDILLILNIQVLFAVSIYTSSNHIAVNALVGVAIVQFITFSFYQRGLIGKAKAAVCILLSNSTPTTKEYFNNKSLQPIELQNPIPEVAYNYREFQEPLIGLDEWISYQNIETNYILSYLWCCLN